MHVQLGHLHGKIEDSLGVVGVCIVKSTWIKRQAEIIKEFYP